MRTNLWISLMLFMVIPASVLADGETGLFRFPAIYGEQLVFSYAGDLYTVEKTGGIARKLTNDPQGYEMFARFSPDGKTIAFTAQYDGNTEVYLMPASGGVPKRLTFTATLNRDDISDRMGPNNIVMAWRDNQSVVYRSRKQTFNDFKGQLFVASTQGGLSEELPLPAGGFCSYSPDGKRLAFNQVFREFRTWKYYAGGMADDIWIYDFTTRQTVNITNNTHQDIFPMWKGDFIYFLSDRDRIMNLFAYNTKTRQTDKLTNYTDFDIKFPSLGDNAIVYEKGGQIFVFDLSARQSKQINIRIADDFAQGRNVWKDASKSVNSWSLSPDGKRAVFGARGDVFTVPAKPGITYNLTASPGVHERNVEWSPDGKHIAYISDENGEDEIYIRPADGTGTPNRLTNLGDTYKYGMSWSPDSRKILWSDKLQRLQYVDIDTKKITLVEQTQDGELRSFSWSPDSRWIAYTLPISRSANRIVIFEVAGGRKNFATDAWFDSSSPVFSPDGKYLYFNSSRDFSPVYSWTEWNHAYVDMQKIYLLPLEAATSSPFAPKTESAAPPAKAAGDKKDAKNDKTPDNSQAVEVKIDFAGIETRAIALPIDAGSYWNLNPLNGMIYYNRASSKDEKASLRVFDLESKKETVLGDYSSFILTPDGKKMMLAAQGKYAILDTPKSKISPEEFVDLSNMKVFVDLKQEWTQVFTESWRQMRDFFYDPAMHGVDWKAVYKKYAPLVQFVNNRNDLNYIIGEMIGELSVGHAYVSGGDKPRPERIQTGLLGARLKKDATGFFVIEKILAGENWNPGLRSPLTMPGMNIQEGDYILALDGRPTNLTMDLYEWLIGKAGKQVELLIGKNTDPAAGRKIIVEPVADEAGLYYFNWVRGNIEKVSKATNGEVGYIHIPDMGVEGLNEFVKYFYPQLSKRALIIDDRGNGGGNVSPMIIERLRRELSTFSVQRNAGVTTRPGQMLYGPKVLLLDRYSASDGDLFPYQFKHHKLGKTIGQRSWGGVVGIRGSLPMIDGGVLNKPEFAPFDLEGKQFIIEGYGVDPDIEVLNDPAREYAGEDEQLNKAIEVILEELKNWPASWPPVPDYPDKSGK